MIDLDSPDLLREIKSLTVDQLKELAAVIRGRIIDVMSKNGGHLASSLGAVDMIVAMHHVFDSPKDTLIYDTSHQSYAHKLITGRNHLFDTVRKYKGLSGFTHPPESPHDLFFAGHAGNALSLALGQAKARDITNRNNFIVAALGDASLTCGLTFEALNNMPKDALKRFIIILNDNDMSIANNVGALNAMMSRVLNNPKANNTYRNIGNLLAKVPFIGKELRRVASSFKRSVKTLVSCAPFFEHFNLSYTGMIDGHDIKQLTATLQAAKASNKPVLVHIRTKKGYGLENALQEPIAYHGVKPFDRQTGVMKPQAKKMTFPKLFGSLVLELSKQNKHLITVTPAMPAGSCLLPVMKQYPDRCIDVGIAEGHSITYAAGIAKNPATKVIASIYSTFLQRAVDNVYHDVALQNIPLIIAIDRAGIAGGDGITHNGIYDIGLLAAMPNMVICQPRDGYMLKALLLGALSWSQPTAIRYPNLQVDLTRELKDVDTAEIGKAEILQEGEDILLIGLGHMCDVALDVADRLTTKGLKAPTVVDLVFAKPLDKTLLLNLTKNHRHIITIEEHITSTGIAALIDQFLIQEKIPFDKRQAFGVPDRFIEHGDHSSLMMELGLDAKSMTEQILQEAETRELLPL